MYGAERMKWFKHYSSVSTSVSLNQLMDELGLEAYARYWLLLEYLCEKYDGDSTTFCVHFNDISPRVKIKFSKKFETFMQKLHDFQLILVEIQGKVYKIEAPILRELQSRDYKKARKDRVSEAPKNKNKNKTKNKTKNNVLSPTDDCVKIINHLNEKTGKSFKATGKKTITIINARFSEEFSIEDFKKVIDTKCEQWLNDSSMSQYLRPETLFGTKFESYLNEKPKGVKRVRLSDY